MQENRYISLKVCGRPHENSGFNPQVSFNSPTFEVPDTVYSGMNDCSYFFTIIIENAQVVYSLIMNNVRSCGGLRLGNLKIVFSIPKGYKLSNDKSPYDVLVALKDHFVSSCMICADPVKMIYEFKSGLIDPSILDDKAKEYPLVAHVGPYRPMSIGGQKAFIVAPEEKISQLLCDVQYREFSPYSEIVVAKSVQNTNYVPIANLNIPRDKRFSIIIDGVADNRTVTDIYEQLSFEGKRDPRYYTNKKITFSIFDIRNGIKEPNITIDEEHERISVVTSSLSEPLSKKVTIDFPSEAANYFYTFSQYFQLDYNGRPINLNNFAFTLSGDDIKMLENPSLFNIRFFKNDNFKILDWKLTQKNVGEYELAVRVQKVVKTDLAQIKGPDSIKVIYSLRESQNFDGFITLQKDGISELRIKVDRYSNKGEFFIPSSWKSSNLVMKYKTKEGLFETRLSYNNGNNTYLADNFSRKQLDFYDRIIRPRRNLIIAIIGMLLGFIAGCAAMYYTYPFIEELSSPTQRPTNVETSTNKIKCETCNMTFPTQNEFVKHNNEVHLSHECNRCSARFETKEKLTDHINTTHLKVKCDKCNFRCETEAELSKHKEKKHKINTGREDHNNCTDCHTPFDNKEDLYKHMQQQHGKWVCPVCGRDKWFNTQQERGNHIRQNHPEYNN